MVLDANNLSYLLGLLGLGGIVFTIYNAIKNPQVDVEKTTIKLREDVDSLRSIIEEVKETHLKTVEADIRKLTETIQQLSLTVVKLSTIIDERIPKSKRIK